MTQAIPQEAAFLPRVPDPGVVFTPTQQNAIDAIEWDTTQQQIFIGAMMLKVKLPFMGTPTDAEMVAMSIDLSHHVQEQITALRVLYREHDNRSFIRENT